MNFAKNLIAARIRMKYSSKELAQKLGISPTTYSNYELGLREPRFHILRKISTVLNISTDKLLNIDTSARNEFYLEQGIEIMRNLGFFKVENPFDFYNFGKYNLCFARTEREHVLYLPSTEELTTFVAFTKEQFVSFIEDADILAPGKQILQAQNDLLIDYIFSFLSFGKAYDGWLDDLDVISTKNRSLHPEIYELFINENIMRADAIRKNLENTKGFISRADADYLIKLKADMSYLYVNDFTDLEAGPYFPYSKTE